MVFGKAATQTQYNFMNHSINTSMPRRDFLKRTAVLTAGLATLGGIMPLRAAKGPNEKVVVAIIGCNDRGMKHIESYLNVPKIGRAHV